MSTICPPSARSKPRVTAPVRRAILALGLVLVVLCGLVPESVHAADDVVLLAAAEPGGKREEKRGAIVDYSGRGLRLAGANGAEELIPAVRVLSLDTERTADHQQGDRLRGEGDYAAAVEAYRKAARQEKRNWVQRELLARMVDCYTALEQYDKAGAGFLLLLKSDPQTPYMSCFPLAWFPYEGGVELERQARAWLTEKGASPANLLGASWLMSSGLRLEAAQKMQELTQDANPLVAQLAEAQLWRGKIVTARKTDLDRWLALCARLPAGLRAGPMLQVAKVQARLSENDAAAVTLMEVAILHPQQPRLAGEALLAAGRALEAEQRSGEALTLYREVAQRFPLAGLAEQARQRIAQAQPEK